MPSNPKHLTFLILLMLCFFPFISSGTALLMGILLSLSFGNPYLVQTRNWTSYLLQISVVGLGAGMNLITVAQVGTQGLVFTLIGISLTMGIGLYLGKTLKTHIETSMLVSAGTAICGGSAIAAVAPIIGAGGAETSVALATVFVLNSVALFIFPHMGHWIGLDQHQFGLWSALAIHDTSSVVGAALQYGPEALQTATTVKLARALWIVPLAFIVGSLWNHQSRSNLKSIKKPWFILGFLMMAAIVTWIPALETAGGYIVSLSKRGLVVTLFLIGSGLSGETLKKIGPGPFLQGILLWVIAGTGSLAAILWNWI
jgi:uncharacterized integral membrane protein (TIGR00698 family)